MAVVYGHARWESALLKHWLWLVAAVVAVALLLVHVEAVVVPED
jgi:hypothetical protein